MNNCKDIKQQITSGITCYEKHSVPLCDGMFYLRVLDRQNKLITEYTDHNLIVANSKTILATLIGGTGLPITKIGLGTGADPADISDMSLTSPTYLPFTSVEYPDLSTVKFNWYLGYDQMNGVVVTEYGLVTESNGLFSRRVYGPITKNSDMAFSGAWSIKFYTA
jgi:hypothetical protein